MRLIRLLPAAVVLLVLVVFALSNRQVASFAFWPTDFALNAPLGIAVLVCAAVAFLAGALVAWVGTVVQRRRARRAEAQVRLLEAQVVELKARLAAPVPVLAPPDV
jgi:lipopolysaccharide assembly protein A